MKLIALALVLAVLAPPVNAAEPLGRLFYSADQRSQLDAARSKRARVGDKADEPPPAPTPEIVTYGGVVRRSDGKTTVWLNNRAVSTKDSADAKMLEKIRPDGTVTLQSSQTGRHVDLRVGQRADLLSGRVDEGYRRAPFKPEPKADPKADPAGDKPSAEPGAAPDSERRRTERERQDNLDDAVRAMRDAAQTRSSTPPPQESGAPVTVFPAPMQAPAQAPVPAPTQYR